MINIKNNLNNFNINFFLTLSINISAVLHEIHSKGQIHKSICPSLIHIDKTTGSIKLEKCKQFIENGKLIDSSDPANPVSMDMDDSELKKIILPFISPEQTGRLDWPLGFRSDIYSLGIVLYQWATGHHPFYADDPIGFFHCHIAVEPILPEKINRHLPTQISKIIIKLMNKSPTDRYQSAMGLIKDFEKCREMLNTSGKIRPFLPGEYDFSHKFRVKEKIYGRTRELSTLRQWFELVKQGHGKMAFVTGYSGIGKTSLVKEFETLNFLQQDPGVTPRFISGKFDSLDQNRPYHALVLALQQMAQQILSQDNKSLGFWKTQLKQGLKIHGQVIADMAPELTAITGPLPKLPEFNPQEAQTLFEISFFHFIKTVCRPEYPVTIFLDDLQWADAATIHLLKALKNEKIPWLFIVGAFRSNEVSSRHPLYSLILELQKDNDIITLDSLNLQEISGMITGSTRMGMEDASFLAEIVAQKTKGNPFFIIDFLTSLYRNKLLVFNFKKSVWQFNAKKINYLNITDNVAAQIKERMVNLTHHQMSILNIASCMTGQFSEDFLSKVSPGLKKEIVMDLAFLAGQNLLINTEGAWRFSHDKIRETIYLSMNRSEREQLHYDLGNALLCDNPSDDTVFEILQHLNNCTNLMSSKEKKTRLASLNLKAGLISKTRVAFEATFYFAQKGLDLLWSDTWTSEPELTLALHFLAGETGYYTKNIEAADQSLRKIKKNVSNLEDRVRAYEIMMINFTHQGRAKEAIAQGLEVLDILGMGLPEKVAPWMIVKELVLTRFYLIGKNPETLVHLPKLSDPEKKMVIRIFIKFFDASFLGAPEYVFLLVLKILNLTLKYGETELSGYAYALYGAVLCEKFGKYDEGFKFGKLALKIHKQPYTIRTKCKTYMIFGGMINHWKNHLKSDLPYLMEAYKFGMENGNDLMFASFSLNHYLSDLIFSGKPLSKVFLIIKKHGDVLKMTKKISSINGYNLLFQYVLTLMGKVDDPLVIKGKLFDETIELPKMEKEKDSYLIGLHVYKLMIGYFFYDFEKAVEAAESGIKLLNNSIGMLVSPYCCYFQSLSMLALYPELDKKKQKAYLTQVKKNLKKFKRIAKHSPKNFFNMYALIQAELAGLKGQAQKAFSLYDQAIDSARKNGFTHLEAIASECAAKYFLKKKQNTIAAAYMRKAHQCFTRWGTKPKVKHLETLYSDLLVKSDGNQFVSSTMKEPDLISIIKASRAIAEETDIQGLMDKLMDIVIENAGARIGFLILLRDGLPMVEARASSNDAVQTGIMPVPVENCPELPDAIINYVIRTKQTIILSDAANKGLYTENDYIKTKKAKSILCVPMIHDGQVTGALYLENSRASHVFTEKRVIILKMVTDILTNAWSRRKAQKDLLVYQEKLRALSSQIALAEEKQRRGVAIGLHDRIGQSLTLARIKLSELNSIATSEKTKEKIKDIVTITEQTIVQTRSLTFDLSSPELYELGIEAALDSLCERKSQLHNIPIEFLDDERPKPLDETSSILLYQAARELLFNIIKHAKAKKILVFINRIEDSIQIIIKDNGIGFDAAQLQFSKRTTDGFGLFSIQERINHHNGSFSIESKPGRGTKVTLMTPLKIF
ncbi:MAG: AAA family ATPase [Desulfobacula sp.]|uniref:AAA family ATPase n=1 Tax=Desulfobacula sp. TaxID=2593537 RepID=UPI0025BEBD1A|nr:AAA family ATPase [Desulfobacula sp.]MCD4722557.1 AAA family ATPase [Desulfobacula sp.]